ncbi:MAG: hypothetical protein KQH53_16330 [Desulfarculaceae bacterium]|nr:hypothetical protein [Desulfarculaceae bacterium]
MSLLWNIVDTLEPGPDHAQIVIGVPGGPGLAKRLEQLGPWLARELAERGEPGAGAEAVLVVATTNRDLDEVRRRTGAEMLLPPGGPVEF